MAKHLHKTALELKKAVAEAIEKAREAALTSNNARVRVNDGEGLRIDCTPSASTSWQLVYRMPGQTAPKTFTIGPYPALGMSVARDMADKLRVKIAQGIDPNAEKQALRVVVDAQKPRGDTLGKVLDAYMEECARKKQAARSITTVRRAFDYNVVPDLGEQVAKTITAEQIERILRKVEARNSFETVRRLAGWLKQAFANAGIKPNPALAVDLSDFKRPIKSAEGHPATTDPRVLAQVLRTVDAFEGSQLSRATIMLHARTFVRPDELRLADWDQWRSDFFHAQVILKDNVVLDHLVPLAPQTQALLASIRLFHPTFVLPGTKHGQRMSDSTLGRIMHALGWKDVQSVHGFRKSASTLLNEMGWAPRWVDMQLSHKLKGKGSEGVYNKAKYLQQRIPMMQCWSDYVDALLDPTSGADTMLPMRWRQRWLRQHPPIPPEDDEDGEVPAARHAA